MDTESLVEEQIDDGQKLVLELLRSDFDVTVALWVRANAEGMWQLYISSSSVPQEKPSSGYRQVYASLKRSGAQRVSPSEITLIHPANPVSVAAVMARDSYPGGVLPTRFNGKRLGPMDVDGVYIYPRERWFKGFDEIKKNFPSAVIFTMPILSNSMLDPVIHECIGKINADVFQRRRPSTVYFLGPQGQSGRTLAELYFIHRAEGWNTLFRAETNSWEEVVHGQTGQKLYEAADFSRLEALKTDVKPGARELEHIRRQMEGGGYYLTIPPDPTPIRQIPFTPPRRPGEEPGRPIDWETLRRMMEAGATIELRPGEPV